MVGGVVSTGGLTALAAKLLHLKKRVKKISPENLRAKEK
jgi:hypothetical protein